MLVCSSLSLGSFIQKNQSVAKPETFKNSIQANRPIWPIGTEWIYDVSFSYSSEDYTDLSISLNLASLNCEVTDNTQYYYLALTAPLRGTIILDTPDLPRFTINFKDTDFDADLILYKNNLSIKESTLFINGKITINLIPLNLDIEIRANASPPLELIHFPITVGKIWELNSSYLDLSGFLKLPGIASLIPNIPEELEFDYAINIASNLAECSEYINISTPAGIYPAFNITYDEKSTVFYSPVIGNIIHINIPPAQADYIQYSLSFQLRSTNYLMPGAPLTPDLPMGEIEGKPNQPYEYSAVTTDSEGDQIYYLFDWGDGTFSPWIGPVESGETANATKTWDQRGTYNVHVKAKDIFGNQSPWSDPLRVTMPKSKSFQILTQFLDWMKLRFPKLFSICEIMVDNIFF